MAISYEQICKHENVSKVIYVARKLKLYVRIFNFVPVIVVAVKIITNGPERGKKSQNKAIYTLRAAMDVP